MKAVKVPKDKAEEIRRKLREQGNLLQEYTAESDKQHVYFPVQSNTATQYELVDKEFTEKQQRPSFEECLEETLTEEEQSLVKTSQDIIGDIAIIEVEDALAEKQTDIADCLLTAQPYINTVLKKGKHTGQYRTQDLEWLAGEKKKNTVHTENGVDLHVHVEDMYYSPRLATERKRIASLVTEDEEVLVMFSGCGPYPLVIAENSPAERVVGVEINPTAHDHAVENAHRNNLDHVQFYQGDVAEVVPNLDTFDRVIMPAPDNAEHYLPIAFDTIRSDGVIHFYNFFDTATVEENAETIIRRAASLAGIDYRIEDITECGSVAPGRHRYCVQIRILK